MLDDNAIINLLCKCFPGKSIVEVEPVEILASLWAGMGHVVQIKAKGVDGNVHIVAKHISMPPYPREQLTLGDLRKVSSYDVEVSFYKRFSPVIRDLLDVDIIPRCYYVNVSGEFRNEVVICMSPLPGPVIYSLRERECTTAVRSMAMLHSCYWGSRADVAVEQGLQPQGGYWYLDTRPDEFNAIPRSGLMGRLRKAAVAIDTRLKQDRWQCIIHGDLKGCNMSYSPSEDLVQFCDFQYCGKSCAMKDMAYFLAVTAEESAENAEDDILSLYLNVLHDMLQKSEKGCEPAGEINHPELPTLHDLKIGLDIAYTDLYRWMAGWGYWGNTSLLRSRTGRVLDLLDEGTELQTPEAYSEAMRRVFPVRK